jgi:hypothetical protein
MVKEIRLRKHINKQLIILMNEGTVQTMENFSMVLFLAAG